MEKGNMQPTLSTQSIMCPQQGEISIHVDTKYQQH